MPDSSPNLIRIIDLRGKVDSEIHVQSDKQLLDMAYSAARREFIVITRSSSDPFLVEKIRLAPFEIRTIYRSKAELDTPQIAPDGQFCLIEVVEGGVRKIIRLNLQDGRILEVAATATGDNHVEAIDPDSQSFIYTRRGSSPSAVLRYDLRTAKIEELYSRRSLSSVPVEEHWTRSSDGVSVPLYVWRGAQGTTVKAAIIRLHGFNVKETPTWQQEIQIMASHGITYVACNYRGSLGFGFEFEKMATPENQVSDVQATIEYVHYHLGIPYDRIVLLGYSAGANLALRTAAERLPEPGILVLVGLSAMRVEAGVLDRIHHPQVLIFHGTYEDEKLEAVKATAEQLAQMSESRGEVSLFELSDNHDFNYPESRGSIYSAILDALVGH